MEGLQIAVSYTGNNDEVTIISPRGYIDTTTVQIVEDKFTELVSQNKYKFIVDLKDTEYINSSGWGAFLRDLKVIRENKGDLVLANMIPEVHVVYETMEFSKILKSFESLEAALINFT
jgi:anti-anti-sigma factor